MPAIASLDPSARGSLDGGVNPRAGSALGSPRYAVRHSHRWVVTASRGAACTAFTAFTGRKGEPHGARPP